MKRNPIKYYGGKQRLSKILVNYIPIHDVFVEVFGGAANLIVKKNPKVSKLEIYNDINDDIVNLFKVIRNKKKFNEFRGQLLLLPYSRKQHEICLKLYKGKKWEKTTDIKKAAIYFYLLRSSFSGKLDSWSFNIKPIGMPAYSYISAIKLLPELCDRLRYVQFECSTFERIFELYDDEKAFFYLDPPYLPKTRVAEDVYEFEMSKEEHKKLLKVIQKAKGMVLLSGYSNKLYDNALKGWGREEIEVSLSANLASDRNKAGRPKRVEVLWFNYDKPKSRIKSRKRLF